MRGRRVGIVGARGAVGREFLRVLEERRFPAGELQLFGSGNSAGAPVPFAGSALEVRPVAAADWRGFDFVFLSAGADVSREVSPRVAAAGAVAIDNSFAFRLDPGVPLVVPEVNAAAVNGHKGIIANPNCSTIQLVVALAPLEAAARIRRIVVSTYQSVSGTGTAAVEELRRQSAAWLAGEASPPSVYPHPIAFNLIPHIDVFLEDGSTLEEYKMVEETRKILGRPDLAVAATTVRVPVVRSHSEAVAVEFERPLDPDDARRRLAGAPGVVVLDAPERAGYPLPRDAEGRDEVFVGRIRRDPSVANGLLLWIVADNLRKGAATNAVQIAELLLD
jgi:aspartate-semialdehyde dehydrogenase